MKRIVASFTSFTISWLPNKDEIKSTYRWISRSDSWNIVLRNLSFYVPLACNRITQYGKVTNGENVRGATGREVKGDSPSGFRSDVRFICKVIFWSTNRRGSNDKMGTGCQG